MKKNNWFFTGGLILLFCLASGCRTHNVKAAKDVLLTPRMEERAGALKKIVAKCKEFGVYIDEPSRQVYAKTPEILATRCRMLGVTDAYLTVSIKRYDEDDLYGDQLRNLASRMKQCSIRVWIILDNVSFFTWADKLGKAGEHDITEDSVEDIIGFAGDTFAERGRVAGILLVVKPEKMNNSNPDLPSNLLYSWGADKYGIGNDNDTIMNYSFRIIRAVKRYAGKTQVILVIPHFLHDDKRSGKLSSGDINEFLAHSDRVIITDFTSKFKKVRLQAETELRDAKKPQSVTICMKMDTDAINGNAYGEAVNSKNWDYIMRGFEYIIRKAGPFPSFRGITIYDYAGLERTWEFAD
jgi:hypothetical protein